MKRKILSFLSATLLSYLLFLPISFMGPTDTVTSVIFGMIPLVTVVIYYGHSVVQLMKENNELLRGQITLKKKEAQEEQEASGEQPPAQTPPDCVLEKTQDHPNE